MEFVIEILFESILYNAVFDLYRNQSLPYLRISQPHHQHHCRRSYSSLQAKSRYCHVVIIYM